VRTLMMLVRTARWLDEILLPDCDPLMAAGARVFARGLDAMTNPSRGLDSLDGGRRSRDRRCVGSDRPRRQLRDS
jgi:hypothetical protein